MGPLSQFLLVVRFVLQEIQDFNRMYISRGYFTPIVKFTGALLSLFYLVL